MNERFPGCRLHCGLLGGILALLLAGFSHAGEPGDAIRQRLDQAKTRLAEQTAALNPVARELLLWADFEQDGMLCLGQNGALPVELAKDHYQPGKFGRGFHFERPRHNQLPPAIADLEDDLTGLKPLGSAKLSTGETATAFGRKALALELPGAGTGMQTAPLKAAYRSLSWHEKEWTLLASAWIKGPRDAKLKLEVAFQPKDWTPPAPAKNAPKDAPAVIPRIADQSFPEKVTLTGDWQRLACRATADMRVAGREAVFSVTSEAAGPVSVLVDGMQFEQANYYPFMHLMPTTWLPGGTSAPATNVIIGSPFKEQFPYKAGSMAFWTRTPRQSNLPKVGNSSFLNFSVGYAGGWGVNMYRLFAGGKDTFLYFTQSKADDGDWHHVALTWDEAKAYAYKDGQCYGEFERKGGAEAPPPETYVLNLGGAVSDGQTANAVMDEVGVYRRTLTAAEVASLAAAAAPLPAAATPLLLAAGARRVFYRDETAAKLDVRLTLLTPVTGALTLDLAVDDKLFLSRTITPVSGVNTVSFEFTPCWFACGEYSCRVAVLHGTDAGYAEFPVQVVPALRTDLFLLSSWGANGDTAAWREFHHTVGFNAIDTYSSNFEQLGQNGFRYGWHHNFGNGVWSPENRAKVRDQARTEARKRSVYPNWSLALLNSEVATWPVPDVDQRQAWFDAWAEKELGFPFPEKGWALGTTHNPISAWFPEGQKPGADGVYRDSREMAFLTWWYNRGCGWWRLGAEVADEIKKQRPDIITWTDPLRYPGQIADLDAGGNWSYSVTPEPLLGEFAFAWAAARGTGKKFYATLGMHYVHPIAENILPPDNKKKILVPTADDMIQQAWLTVTHFPLDGLFYWAVDALFSGLKQEGGYYAEAGSDQRLGEVWKRDLLPIATLLEGVPNQSRTVALLFPESTLWPDAGEGGWGWGTAHYPNNWNQWLGETGLPYDIVLDQHIRPGALGAYKVIIFPMAEFVAEKVYKELTAAGAKGTKIIVDHYGRQQYPGMERWDQEYYHRMPGNKRQNYGEDTRRKLKVLTEQLRPQLEAYAVGSEGKVFTNIREAHGVRFISVVNDNRQAGPYTEWTGKPEFRPYGKAQTATVYLKAPQDAAVYEFTESRLLPTAVEGDCLKVSVSLPPHAGRLLCVYPARLQKLVVTDPDKILRGTPAAFSVTLRTAQKQPATGRQLVTATFTAPDGKTHDESGLYRLTDGTAQIPFRPALNDLPGKWTLVVMERTSGLSDTVKFRVH